MVGVALLVGLAGGAVMAAAAGARRTDSSPARVVLDQRPATVYVNPDLNDLSPDFAVAWAAIGTLPEVKTAATFDGVTAAPVDARRKPDLKVVLSEVESVAVDATVLHQLDRPHLVSGRLPVPDREDEVYINEAKARRQHLHVGSKLHLGIFAYDDFTTAEAFPAPRWVEDFTVVGIGSGFDDAGRPKDDPNLEPIVYFTPAFDRRLHGITPPYIRKEVLLRSDADVPAFESDVRHLFRNVDATNAAGDQVHVNQNFQESSLNLARVRRATRPYVLALWLFAALAAVAALAVLSQMLVRALQPLRADRGRLTALGFSRRQMSAVAGVEGFTIGALGAIIGVVVATAASAVMPIGPTRAIDPSRGFELDVTVIASGVLLMVALSTAGAVLAVRHRHGVRRRSSALSDRLSRTGVNAPVASGARFALDRGRDGNVPVRSTLIGVTVAIAALVTTLLYGADLARFTSSPVRYGWPWTYQVSVGDPAVTPLQAARRIAAEPGVDTVAQGVYSQFEVNAHSVAAVGIDPAAGSPFVPLLSGHAPRSDNEVAFGAATLRAVHAHVGDRIPVLAQSTRRIFRIVGVAVFPRFAPSPGSEPTGLGIGAATTAHTIESMHAPVNVPFVLVRLRPHARESGAQLVRATKQGPLYVYGAVRGPQRPNDVLSYDHLSATPLFLAGLLVILAVGSTLQLLLSSVRNRRRDLAVLKTMGFTSGQTRTAVLVQATVLALLALIVALPAGTLAARWLWAWTAHWLGIAADPTRPALVLTLTAVFTVAAANVIAFGPALLAARTRAATVLRSE